MKLNFPSNPFQERRSPGAIWQHRERNLPVAIRSARLCIKRRARVKRCDRRKPATPWPFPGKAPVCPDPPDPKRMPLAA